MKVSLPEAARGNGSLFAVIYVHSGSGPPWEDSRHVSYVTRLTSYTTQHPPEVTTSQSENTAQVRPRLSPEFLSFFVAFPVVLHELGMLSINLSTVSRLEVCWLQLCACMMSAGRGGGAAVAVAVSWWPSASCTCPPLALTPLPQHHGGVQLQQRGCAKRRAPLLESVSTRAVVTRTDCIVSACVV